MTPVVNRLQLLVLYLLLEHGPSTTGELVQRTTLDWRTVSPRMKPLRRKQLVQIVGVRPGPGTRRTQRVYALTEAGERFVRARPAEGIDVLLAKDRPRADPAGGPAVDVSQAPRFWSVTCNGRCGVAVHPPYTQRDGDLPMPPKPSCPHCMGPATVRALYPEC